MNELKFSIIIPSFNQGHFIEATLLSIFNQDYSNCEIIVLDGGSTDNTVSILEKYSDRISYWRSQKDNGQADAIATGFSMASGDVLCWLNSDDVYLPGTLKAVNEAFNRSKADVVYGDIELIDAEGKNIGRRFLTDFLPDFMREVYLCGGFGIYQPAAFWSKDIYTRSGGVDPSFRFCMDTDLFNKFVLNGGKFFFVDALLAAFRVHGDSKTSTQQSISKSENSRLFKKYVTERKTPYPAWKRFCARVYKGYKLVRKGKLIPALKARYTEELKWVP